MIKKTKQESAVTIAKGARRISLFFLIVFLSLFICTTSVGPFTDSSGRGSSGPDSRNDSFNSVTQGNSVKETAPREAVVMIDPGHGGVDLGTVYGSMYEKNLNLDISKRMGVLLKKAGIKVAFTRETDSSVELKDRAEMANDVGAALFVSVHNNKMPDNPAYKGTETLYALPQTPEEGKMNGERFATLVQRELVQTLKTYNNGIIYRPNLAVLRRTEMPAVIAEIAYISNAEDRKKLSAEEFREKAAEALSNAVVKALKEMGIEKDTQGKWMENKIDN